MFSYFDLLSELFLVSMVDIYSKVTQGMTHIKLFLNKTGDDASAWLQPKKAILSTLAKSFGDYVRFVPTTSGKLMRKTDVLDNLFFKAFLKEEEHLQHLKAETLALIAQAHAKKDTSNVGHLAHCLINLLSYKQGVLLSDPDEAFRACFQATDIFCQAVASLKIEVSFKPDQASVWDKQRERHVLDHIRQLEQAIQLFMYVTELGKIASDLAKLSTIIDDSRFREMQATLESLKAQRSLFQEHRERTAELYERFTLAMVELFKALHQVDP